MLIRLTSHSNVLLLKPFHLISSHISSVTACGKHLGASGNFKTEYYGNEFYRSKVDVCVERMRQSMVFDFNFERYKTCMCSDAGDESHLIAIYCIDRHNSCVRVPYFL